MLKYRFNEIHYTLTEYTNTAEGYTIKEKVMHA